MGKEIVIIGGGIIGYCSAYFLSEGGHKVTILDRSNNIEGASHKNAGMVVPSHFIPLASPGIIKKGLKWMLKSDSPFYIKPRLNLDLLKWGWHFYRHANTNHVNKYSRILASMNNKSRDLYNEFNNIFKDDFSYKSKGLLMLFKSEEAEKEEIKVLELAHQVGVDARYLSCNELNDLDKGTTYDVKGAVYYPGDAFMDPGKFMQVLEKHLIRKGVAIQKGIDVTGFKFHKSRIKSIVSNEKSFEGEEFLISAGVYSTDLAKKLNYNLPMQGGKGYSITVEKPENLPEICSILVESKVAVTPFSGNLRLAGTMEIAGQDLSINHKRVNGYLKSVEQYMPDFPYNNLSKDVIWAGLRPCSPDGIPYLGRASKYTNLLFATGHSMMGLSLGPVSGDIVADIIDSKGQYAYLDKLSPDRFS